LATEIPNSRQASESGINPEKPTHSNRRFQFKSINDITFKNPIEFNANPPATNRDQAGNASIRTIFKHIATVPNQPRKKVGRTPIYGVLFRCQLPNNQIVKNQFSGRPASARRTRRRCKNSRSTSTLAVDVSRLLLNERRS
jgi:hypothetical protein